jgi:RNA polymerase sigma-32 factor
MSAGMDASGSSSRPLTLYLRELRKLSRLDPVEETALARRWVEEGDAVAAEILATGMLRLVVKIANGYRGYGLPVVDLIAEGNIGALKAIERFEPARGLRLSTYAGWWIRATILEYVLRSWSLVRICTTRQHRRLFFNLRRLKSELNTLDDGDMPTELVERIARELDVSTTDVVHMNRRLAGFDLSLQGTGNDDEDGAWQDRLMDPADSPETQLASRQELALKRGQLRQALATLNDRERHILTERRLRERPRKLKDLAKYHAVSSERIRQIEDRAVEKLQAWVAANTASATADLSVRSDVFRLIRSDREHAAERSNGSRAGRKGGHAVMADRSGLRPGSLSRERAARPGPLVFDAATS